MTDEAGEHITFTRRGAIEVGVKVAAATGASVLLERNKFSYPQKAEAQRGPSNFPLEAGKGWFYTETRGDEIDPQLGYKVEDPVWPIFQKYGGVDAWGFPETRSYYDDLGRLCQGFQKGIFQLTLGRDGRFEKVEWDNTFDRLSEMGEDHWLESKFIPTPFKFNDTGKTPEQVEQSRLELLEKHPAIKEAFFKSSNELKNSELWKQQYGYPTAVREYPDVVTVRTQRAAIHLWKRDTQWANKGDIAFANGMELIKERTGRALRFLPTKMPIETLLLELPDRAKLERTQELDRVTRERYGAKRLPENIRGLPYFVVQVQSALTLLAKNAPELYAFVKNNLYFIEEGNVNGADARLRSVSLVPSKTFTENDRLSLASLIIHEATQCDLYARGLQAGNKYGEAAAVIKGDIEFGEAIGDPEMVKTGHNRLAKIDLPDGQWWKQQKA